MTVDRWLFRGLVALCALLPIVMLGRPVDYVSPLITGLSSLETGMKVNADTPAKFSLLLWGTAALLLIWLFKVISSRRPLAPSYVHVPALMLFGAVLLSLFFSPYKMVAFQGYYDLFEGTLAYLAYAALLVIAAHTAYEPGRLEAFVWALAPFVALNALIGTLHFFGADLWQVGEIRDLLHPPRLGPPGTPPPFTSTVGNPNYASGFGGVTAAVFLTYGLLATGRRQQVTALSLALGAWAIVLASKATSGFLALLVMLPLIGLAAWRYGAGRRTAVAAAASALGMVLIFGLFFSHNRTVWDETFGFFSSLGQSSAAPARGGPQAAAATEPAAELLPTLPPPAWGPGTGRLYIWKETLSLALQRPLAGHGLDTLAYTFPQLEPEKQGQMSRHTIMVTKPHNWYLNLLYGAGLPALFGLAALAGLSLWHLIRAVWQKRSLSPALLAITAGWVSYLVQTLFNDSHVGLTPLFFIMVGATASVLAADRAVPAAKRRR